MTDNDERYYVQIVNDATSEVVKEMGPMPERVAEKAAAGAGINLDWDHYTVRVVGEAERSVTKRSN